MPLSILKGFNKNELHFGYVQVLKSICPVETCPKIKPHEKFYQISN